MWMNAVLEVTRFLKTNSMKSSFLPKNMVRVMFAFLVQYARGEADEHSDVDFLVDWDYSRISPWGGAGLYEELEALLGRSVDIATESQLHSTMKEQILKDCVPL